MERVQGIGGFLKESGYEATTDTAMTLPIDLVPAVRELIAKRRAS